MKFPSIRIEGSIFSSDILEKIEQGEIPGQLLKDFGFESNVKVKDEIAICIGGNQYTLYKTLWT